jgi:hypothetical protein
MAGWNRYRESPGRYRSAAAVACAPTLLCMLVLVGPRAVTAGEAADPAAILRAGGLTQVDRLWLAPLEIELRKDLAELPKRRERIVVLERSLHERIEANWRVWQASQPAIAAAQQSLARLGTDDPRRDVLQQQIAALQRAAPEPARLSARGNVRTQVVAWNSERNALATAIVRIRQAVPQLQQLYDRLSQSTAMLQALAQLGEGHRLGPQRSYQAELARLAEYERLAYTPWTPVYWQGSHLRFSVLVDERLPLTFCWVDSGSEPATLTHTAAEAAGIIVPQDAPRQSVSLGRDRRVQASRVVVPQLRIGKLVLKEIEVFVLPPEAENRRSGSGHLPHQYAATDRRHPRWFQSQPVPDRRR